MGRRAKQREPRNPTFPLKETTLLHEHGLGMDENECGTHHDHPENFQMIRRDSDLLTKLGRMSYIPCTKPNSNPQPPTQPVNISVARKERERERERQRDGEMERWTASQTGKQQTGRQEETD